ncbi:MAG: hypothetical protein ACI9MC_003701 [Kiritimatiellia bacterium]|jgi:hypothetical protein
MNRGLIITLLLCVSCGGKKAPATPVAAPAPAATAPSVNAPAPAASTASTTTAGNRSAVKMPTPEQAFRGDTLLCDKVPEGQPLAGPDCATAEITCGQTIVGHTKGGVNRYDTRFYERNFCWPGTRNHSGGDERVYMFDANKSPRFRAGDKRQRVSVTFNSPCADLSFTHMLGQINVCPTDSSRICDTANPFTRKNDRSHTNITVDANEVYYFLVEGADDAEGAFSITLECGT